MQFTERFSVAAGTTDRPLQRRGSIFEFIKAPTVVEIGLIQQSGTAGDMLATIISGTDTLLEEGPFITAARFPIYPDDFIFRDDAVPGDRLQIAIRNTTAGALVYILCVRFNPAF